MKVSAETRLTAILEGTRAGTWEWHVQSGELVINERWAQMLGYEPSDLEPISIKTWENLTHPHDRRAAQAKIERVLQAEDESYESVLRMRHKDGSWRFIHARGMVFRDEDLDGPWIVGTHLDVTQQKQTQHQLSQLAESLPGIIYSFVMEPDGTYYYPYISRKTVDFYGFPPEVGMERPESIFEVIHPDDLEVVKDTIEYSYESLCQWVCDYRVLVDGKSKWMRGIAQPERETDGTVTWHGMVISIDDQKKLEEELQRLSTTDELTGAYNRRYVLAEIESQLANHARYGSAFSLISMDIDHFKAVNDTYGHLIGDDVLKRFSDIVSARIRKTDIFARTGGEEFLILMPHTEISDAHILAEGLRETLEALRFRASDKEHIQITISAGIVGCHSRQVSDISELLAQCDQSLYEAKRSGRNRLMLREL